jgi:hypothetical protein
MRKRTLVALAAVVAAAAVAVAVLVVAVASGGGKPDVATGGDPNTVSTAQLEAGLAKIGVKIQYVDASEPVPAVVGLASVSPASPVGFEYQVFPSSDQATVADLGKLPPHTFGWKKPRASFYYEPTIRGVLGNVAYAIYEDPEEVDVEPSAKMLSAGVRGYQLAAQKVSRGLDDALFDAFPANDPYVNALSPTP